VKPLEATLGKPLRVEINRTDGVEYTPQEPSRVHLDRKLPKRGGMNL
jgi:hypothetical protein